MQPLNAARLFSASLSHQQDQLPADSRELVRNLDSSLRSAEDLISDLLDIPAWKTVASRHADAAFP